MPALIRDLVPVSDTRTGPVAEIQTLPMDWSDAGRRSRYPTVRLPLPTRPTGVPFTGSATVTNI